MGDGTIVEFGSVVDAAHFAIAVQKETAAKQAGVARERRIVFRIGINLGDVVVDGDDLLGDGVNVAARLEQLCDPGGVLISGTAYDQLHGKLALPLDFTGEQHVKNISRPVRTYRIRFEGSQRTALLSFGRLRRWAVPAVAVLAVLVAGLVGALRPWDPQVAPAVQRAALPLPDKPSVAVLPFDNLGSDPEQAYFADGFSEDLITDLSKLSGVFVIARNSSWTYKGKPTNVQQIAQELGVRYVLEGSVRRQGEQIRINAQLIDALGGHHLWADRYDGALQDVFGLQDKVIGQIVGALAVKLSAEERARVSQAEVVNPQAYDDMLQGRELLRKENEQDTLKAISLFERAVELDPSFRTAYAALAAGHWRMAQSSWGAANIGFQRAFDNMNANLAKAMEKPNSLALGISAEFLSRQGRNQEALANVNRALELAPNDPDTRISKAKILNATGRAAEAEQETGWAMRLNPQYPAGYLRVLALSQFHQERYEEAIEKLRRVISLQPDVSEDYTTLVAALGHLGRSEGITDSIEKYNALTVPAGFDPLTVQETGWWWYGDMFSYHKQYRERLLAGLRKAGVPEGAGADVPYDEYTRIVSRSEGEYTVAGTTKIDAATAKGLHDRGVRFVDVRTALAYSRGHIPGAHLLDGVITLTKEKLIQVVNKDADVVFYCYGKYCPLSTFSAARAVKWGFSRVHYFAGGLPAWADARYPIEVGTTQ